MEEHHYVAQSKIYAVDVATGVATPILDTGPGHGSQHRLQGSWEVKAEGPRREQDSYAILEPRLFRFAMKLSVLMRTFIASRVVAATP